jgi:tetratricopeptide (TPR) repeat protein
MPALEWIRSERGRRYALGFMLFLGTLLLYLPVRNYSFINYDDGLFVYQNPHVLGGLTIDGLKWAFTSHDIDYWRPLSWVSHMIDVELFGLNAGGHHVTSAVIHAANAVLLFLFGLAVWSRATPAFLCAAIFAWHPVHVESVAWVAERKDVLCGFFWLAALLAHVRGRQDSRGFWPGMTALCFVLGIMSKPMIVTLPFQLVLLDLWPLKRVRFGEGVGEIRADLWRCIREKWLLFLITFGVCVWTYLAQREANAMAAAASMGPADRLGNVLVSYARYLGNIFWPRDLAVFYPLVPRWPLDRVFGAGVLILTASAFVVARLRTAPQLFAGWFWFVGTLVPVIGIVHVGGQSMADRYTYLPAIGIYLAVVSLATAAAGSRRWLAVLGVGAGLLFVSASRQIRTWENGITVFSRAISVTEDNWLAMNNLANNHAAQGDWAAAAPWFEKVAVLNPGYAESHYNVALARAELGLVTEAEAAYRRALDLSPDHFNALKNLANLLTDRLGRHAESVEIYRRALVVRPDDVEVRQYLVDTLMLENRAPEAAAECAEILRGDPGNESAAITLARLMVSSGRTGEAMTVLGQALSHRPDSAYLHYHAGIISSGLSRVEESRSHFGRALDLATRSDDRELQRAVEAQLNGANR